MFVTNHWFARAGRGIFLAVVAIMFAPAGRVAAESQATPVSQLISPDGRKIAYAQIAVGPDGEQKVRVVVGDADGAHRRGLPIDAEAVDEVQWYGNDRIAYVTEHGEDGYRLMDLDGKAAGELRMPPGCDSFFHQCLSPDGKTIAYCGNYAEIDVRLKSNNERRRYFKEHADVKESHGLFLVELATQSVKQVLDETVANLPTWSPDSKYVGCGIGQYVKDYPLVVVERESGKVHRPAAKGTAAAWSPDAKRLAIVTDIVQGGSWLGGTPLDGAIGILDVAKFMDSGETQINRVSELPANISTKEPYSWSMRGSYGAVWSPDGTHIAYRHRDSSRSDKKERASRDEIWLVQPDGKGARKVLNHGAEDLAWADDHTLLWVNNGQFGTIDTALDGAAAIDPTPETPENQFSVVGLVTDGEGRPMEGVEISAATGIGSLKTGTPVKTDAAGRYDLTFGPGIMTFDGGPNLQAATVHARKAGFYERDLCQNANLGMANFRPKDLDDSRWHFKAIVYRGHPYKLDFVMLPAAEVHVELVNPDGKPLANYTLDLSGDELYPSTNILESKKTNDEGAADFADVPLKPYWFSLGRRNELRTEALKFSKPGEVHCRLIYDDIAGTLTAERP